MVSHVTSEPLGRVWTQGMPGEKHGPFHVGELGSLKRGVGSFHELAAFSNQELNH